MMRDECAMVGEPVTVDSASVIRLVRYCKRMAAIVFLFLKFPCTHGILACDYHPETVYQIRHSPLVVLSYPSISSPFSPSPDF